MKSDPDPDLRQRPCDMRISVYLREEGSQYEGKNSSMSICMGMKAGGCICQIDGNETVWKETVHKTS